MEKLAKAVKLAVEIKEESFDKEMAEENKDKKFFDFNKCYKISLREAADKAAEKVGFDERGAFPVYLLLEYCWNDILDWAKKFD